MDGWMEGRRNRSGVGWVTYWFLKVNSYIRQGLAIWHGNGFDKS
jgi:hypothetical protein